MSGILKEEDIIKNIVPVLTKFSTDNNEQVRVVFAEMVLKLCPTLGKKGTNMHILNIFLLLLRDESPKVRQNMFRHLKFITDVVGVETLQQSITPAFKDLAKDKNWRIRKDIIKLMG